MYKIRRQILLTMSILFFMHMRAYAQQPYLFDPVNGYQGHARQTTFTWTYLNVWVGKYEIQVDDNSDFSSPAIDVESDYKYYNTSLLLYDKTYWWRVRAYLRTGSIPPIFYHWSDWFGPSMFTTCLSTPFTVALLSPVDGSLNLSQPVTLDWTDVPITITYRVQVDNNADFSSPEIDMQSNESQFVANGLASGETYYWRVQSISFSAEFFNYCPAWSFQTKGLGDVNCDGKVNVGDAVFLINYIFKGGTTPHCP
jgi:hypothetical protein